MAPRRLTTAEFVERCQKTHGETYDYPRAHYVGSKKKLTITCRKHGDFQMVAGDHRRGAGCPLCAREAMFGTTAAFIEKSQLIHGETYGYRNAVYVSAKRELFVTCPVHGDFSQAPTKHLDGHGCPVCGAKRGNVNSRKTTGDFISRAKKIHGARKFLYGKVEYVLMHKNVTVTCRKHGDFQVTPSNHLGGKGCPRCKDSKGETKIAVFLDSHGIGYEREAKFTWCMDTRQLPFDFLISGTTILIEFDGKQHFKRKGTLLSEEQFEYLKRHDRMKDEACEREGWTLIRIPYMDFKRIGEILTERLAHLLEPIPT